MFETILYPTDFSEVSRKALMYVKQLRTDKAQNVIVLHVIHRRIIESLSVHSARIDVEEFKENLINTATERAFSIRQQLQRTGFSVKVEIAVGVPLSEILRVEREEDPSIIVIGSHGKTNLREMLLGSVSEKVVRLSRMPVLVVKR